MSTDKAPRTRPSRAAEIEGERKRRRTNFDASFDLQLPVDEAKLDPSFTYRWFNDTPARVSKYTTQDDWEPVNAEEVGVPVEHHVGHHRDGSSMRAILMKKPRKWHEEDQARKIARTEDFENEQMASVGKDLGDKGYVPKNVDNRVRAGRSRSMVPDIAGVEEE